MRNVLYIDSQETENEAIQVWLESLGYTVVRYKYDVDNMGTDDNTCQNVKEILEKDFFYFVCSPEYSVQISTACIATATKYVLFTEDDIANLLPDYINCYCVIRNDLEESELEDLIFQKGEREIYHLITELYDGKKQYCEDEISFKDLKTVKDRQELCRLTDCFFAKKDKQKEITFRLKERMLEYINSLLEQKSLDSWRELVLWNKRLGSRDLKNDFWQFYILWKILFIYAEEIKEYYESGAVPCVIQFESMEQLTETYFKTLFLLRRLEFDVESDTEWEVIDYIVENNLSGIYIKHIIANNQIENKEKVRLRLEEQLTKYEQ